MDRSTCVTVPAPASRADVIATSKWNDLNAYLSKRARERECSGAEILDLAAKLLNQREVRS
jgi:hypothetical protein